jgi:single-stranded-DNA-specific exonuclease
LPIDGLIQPGAATAELVQALERLAPYGVGNPEPRFAVPGAQVMRAEIVGRDHVRCILAGADGRRLKAIAFRAGDGPLGQGLMKARGQSLHVAGRLRLDAWAGRDAVQMIVEDAAPA